MKVTKAARLKFPRAANDLADKHLYIRHDGDATIVGFSREDTNIKYRSAFGMIFTFGLLAGLLGGFVAGIAAPYAARWADNLLQHKSDVAPVASTGLTPAAAIIPPAIQQHDDIINTATNDASAVQNAAQHNLVPAVPASDIKLPVAGDDATLTPDVEETLQKALQKTYAPQIDHQPSQPTVEDKTALSLDEQAAALAHADDFAALEKLQKLARQHPDSAVVEAALGQYLAAHSDMAAGEEHMVEAISLAPDNLQYRLNLAALYDRTHREPQALALYRRIIRAAPDEVEDSKLPLDAVRARAHYLSRKLEGE